MNNKGFAISGILYGILLLFIMILLSLLYALVTRLDRLTTLVEEVNQSVENTNSKDINQTIDASNYYITEYRGKYEITLNGNTCYAYLPKDTLLKINGSQINYSLPDEEGNIDPTNDENLNSLLLINCTNNSVNTFNIAKVYTSIS